MHVSALSVRVGTLDFFTFKQFLLASLDGEKKDFKPKIFFFIYLFFIPLYSPYFLRIMHRDKTEFLIK